LRTEEVESNVKGPRDAGPTTSGPLYVQVTFHNEPSSPDGGEIPVGVVPIKCSEGVQPTGTGEVSEPGTRPATS